MIRSVNTKWFSDSRRGECGFVWPALFAVLWAALGSAAEPPAVAANDAPHSFVRLRLPKLGLEPDELAVIVNDADPDSARIAEYYRKRRGIPERNLIHVAFRSGAELAPEVFARVKKEVDRRTPAAVQAYAVAWTSPYRVDCMSITSALAFGFDRAYCSAQCGATRPSGYFDSKSTAPFTDHGFRPAMMLAGDRFDSVKALIDRGVESDATHPTGTGYLVKTADRARSVRSVTFDDVIARLGKAFRLELVEADFIRDRQDVLFYFTGLVEVPYLDTLRFIAGAIADHLTSTGGQLTGGSQMSSVKWLEAGATGSYGTVVEPCNRLQKFPFPAVAIGHYAGGATLLEAYWKSVAWPGEGVFIGEPLARPFRPTLTPLDSGRYRLRIFAPVPRTLGLEQSASPVGPYRPTETRYRLNPGINELDIELPDDESFFRIGDDIRPAPPRVPGFAPKR